MPLARQMLVLFQARNLGRFAACPRVSRSFDRDTLGKVSGLVSLAIRWRSFNFAGAKLAYDENRAFGRFMQGMKLCDGYSTVTLLAKLRGLSTSVPMAQAVW